MSQLIQAEPAAIEAEPASTRERVVEWLDDRLNPVLVKEVRQALRGKQFRSAFVFTLVVSVIVAISIVLGSADGAEWDPIGPPFFTGVFICLATAVIGFVPMSAFTSMGAEWDENTYDLLVLSHLRPRHIVLGKLLAAGVQALLYFSTFGFYMVFTFLLGGVDLTLVLVAIPLLALISLALSSLAVGLSSLSQKRMVRVALMVLLAIGLVAAMMGTIGMMIGSLEVGVDFASPEVRAILSGVVVASLVVGGLFYVLASSRLAHPEENRSTGLRLLGFVLVLVGLYWANWLYDQIGQIEVVAVLSCFVIAGITLLGAFLVTEREALGMRVAVHLPRGLAMRLLVLPWMPGGGRGVLWVLGCLGLVLAWSGYLIRSSAGGAFGMTSSHDSFALVLGAAAYAVIYLCLPSAILTNRGRSIRRSLQARVAIPVLFVAGILLPAIWGFMVQDSSLASGGHLGNPFWTIERAGRASAGSYFNWPLGPVLWFAGFCLLLQTLRILRGVREVLAAPRRAPADGAGVPPSDPGAADDAPAALDSTHA